MKTLFCFAILVALAGAAEPSPLDQSIGPLRFEKTPLPAALRALSRTGKTMIHAEPGVTGEVTVEFAGGTVRAALTSIVEPAGLLPVRGQVGGSSEAEVHPELAATEQTAQEREAPRLAF